MTKKRLKQLEDIQMGLIKGINYIKSNNTLICSKSLPHSLSYYNRDGEGITIMNKEIGSDLCYLYSALANLTALIMAEKRIELPIETF